MVVVLPAMPFLMRRAATVVLASVLVTPLAAAAEQWLKLTSSHFELYTSAGEKKGREALLYFEQVRDFSSAGGRRIGPCRRSPCASLRSSPRKSTRRTKSTNLPSHSI
jgi:hypothetical protein